MKNIFNFSNEILNLDKEAIRNLAKTFAEVDKVTEYNQQKVLKAFIDNKVSEQDFSASTGYGYDDAGRDKLDRVFAQIVGSQDSLVRFNFVNGTHALSTALFGVLRPNDTMLSVSGKPYDTLEEVIGIRGNKGDGSLKDFGINYSQVELKDGQLDIKLIIKSMNENTKMVYVQRSKGYGTRPALTVDNIKALCDAVHQKNKDTVVLVDNCYGEFVEELEPCDVGANLIAGSLIKNPGGGIARCGGYIAGDKKLIELVSYRLTTQGTGREVGATLGFNRELYMGLFSAPHVTGEALKTAIYSSYILERSGYKVSPQYNEKRTDIIQSVEFGDPDRLVSFCRGIQKGSPVDSFVTPEPWDMPGYESQVIMAAGAFTMGASIELSCDAPIREPYIAYMQGGLNFHSAKAAVLLAVEEISRSSEFGVRKEYDDEK